MARATPQEELLSVAQGWLFGDSYKQIGAAMNPPVSGTAINQRLRRIRRLTNKPTVLLACLEAVSKWKP